MSKKCPERDSWARDRDDEGDNLGGCRWGWRVPKRTLPNSEGRPGRRKVGRARQRDGEDVEEELLEDERRVTTYMGDALRGRDGRTTMRAVVAEGRDLCVEGDLIFRKGRTEVRLE